MGLIIIIIYTNAMLQQKKMFLGEMQNLWVIAEVLWMNSWGNAKYFELTKNNLSFFGVKTN